MNAKTLIKRTFQCFYSLRQWQTEHKTKWFQIRYDKYSIDWPSTWCFTTD